LGKRYDKDIRAIKDDLIKITWWMRGGITLNEVMMLTAKDRETISAFIKENLETTQKTKMPFF
jgi:hypothetical protein